MKKHMIRFMLLPLAVSSQGAQSQESSANASAAQLGEIVVTARRVEEKLQDVPISIKVLSDTDLVRTGITDVQGVATLTPNLTFTAGESGRLAAPVIRSLGVIDTRGFDNSVGVFIDGIYVSGRAAQNVGMLDLKRVEVVKGPQSALYGRNTFAGAINYVSKAPSDKFEGYVEANIATDDLYRVRGAVSGPITENLSGRIAVLFEDDNGTYENAGPLAQGSGIGGQTNKVLSAKLHYEADSSLSFDLAGFYNEERGDNRALSRVANNCGQFDRALVPNLPGFDASVPAYFCGEVPAAASDQLALSPEAFAWKGETARLSFGTHYKSDSGYSVDLLLAYTKSKNSSQSDLDGTQAGEPNFGFMPLSQFNALPPFLRSFIPSGPNGPIPYGTAKFNTYISNPGLDQDYYSADLHVYSPSDRSFRWQAGLFYFRNTNKDESTLGIDASAAASQLGLPTNQIQFLLHDPTPAFIPGVGFLPQGFALPQFLPNSVFLNGVGTSVLTSYDLKVTQAAAFGSIEYDLMENLTGTVELRYTRETQDVDNKVDLFTRGFVPFSVSTTSNYVDPRAIIRYKATDDVMLYGSAAHGTRSGGINPLVTNATFSDFDAETNWTYELGFKSTFRPSDNSTLRLNASAFYIDWNDAQFRQRLPGDTPGQFLTATTNATGITSKGVELDMSLAVGRSLLINAGYGYANATFNDGTFSTGNTRLCGTKATSTFAPIPISCVPLDVNNDGVIDTTAPDLSGKQLRRTANHTANISVQYMYPVSKGFDLIARVDASYRSKMFTDLENTQWTPAAIFVNLRVGFESSRFDGYLWVTNLTQENAIESTNTFNSDLNSFNYVTTAVNIPRRRFGATLLAKW